METFWYWVTRLSWKMTLNQRRCHVKIQQTVTEQLGGQRNTDLRHGNTEDLLTAADCSVNVSNLTTVDGPQVKVCPSARCYITLAYTIS